MRRTFKYYFYLLCLIQIITVTFAKAQPNSIKNQMFGFRIGKNYTIWRPNQVETWCEFKTDFDYSAGFLILKRLNKQFMLNIELLFSGKLFQLEYLVYYNSGFSSFKTSREEIFFIFQIPILINYKLLGNQRKGVRLLAGPSVGVLSRFWLYQSVKRHHSIFGVMFGSEYKLSRLLIGLRYEFNLNDAYHLDYGNTIFNGKLNTISIMAGLVF